MNPRPTGHNRISQRAYEILETGGRHHGHDLDDWLQAENELNGTHTDAIESLIVPIELRTQQAVRALQRLPFCYICGQPFQNGDVKTRDHVPPSALFLVPDRNFPLILPTHYNCNHDRHLEDQTIGQLVGILHEQAPDPEHLRLRLIAGIAADGRLFVAAGGFDLRAIIRRWVLGFHAALYAFGWSQTHPEHGSVPTRSICMGGSIWATSIDLVAVAVSGCTSEPMGRFLTTASEATGIPTTTNQMTRWIRFR